jgi:hypothetical protein
MKDLFKKITKPVLIVSCIMLFSCEKDLYEESIKPKERPNISVEMKEISKNKQLLSKFKEKFKTKLLTSVNAKGEDVLLNLEGEFGKVRLENVLEVKKSDNEKSYSFEIDENVKQPNKYLSLVIDKNDIVWLYKIEKIAQQYNNYPINSERLVRYKLNNDLTSQSTTPCDTIMFPPFQPDPVNNPSTGGGGGPTGGNWQNTPPSGGFFPPIVITPYPGSPGGGGPGGGGSIINVLAAAGDAVASAWNWLIELFTPIPCGCHKRNAVIVELPTTPCDDGGYIAIFPQSPVLDKIYELDALLNYQLKYDDKNYLYTNDDSHLDYFLSLAKNPPANFDTSILPDLITHLRITNDFEFTNEIKDLAINEADQADVNNLVSITTRLDSNSSNMFDDSFALSLDPYVDLDLNALHTPPSTLTPNLFVFHTYTNYRLLRQMNPTWSKAKCAWEATKDVIHLSLDAFGLIPVVGEVADLTNGVLYTIEGEGLNATLSYASAIPIVGWATAGTKFGIKIASTVTGTTKFVWKVTNGVIEFGNRGQLRKVLNLAVGNPLIAHHIIPWAKSTNEVVQKAAKSANAFHMNEALNGIPLSTAVHNGSHAAYDQRVLDRLLEIKNQYGPNMTPEQAYNGLTILVNDIKTAILNNPTTPINQIIF